MINIKREIYRVTTEWEWKLIFFLKPSEVSVTIKIIMGINEYY